MPALPRADRGSVWIVAPVMVAKVRPCLVLSMPTDPQDRVLVTWVPHTTSVQGTRFAVAVQAQFLHGAGVFDAKQIVTVSQVKWDRVWPIRAADDRPSPDRRQL